MGDVKSKNLYELLGNDHDEDSDKEPEPPTKVADKPLGRSSKRNAPDVAPGAARAAAPPAGADRGGRGGRRGNFTGNERAYRDGGAANNRDRPVGDDAARGEARGSRGSRGGRGGRGAGLNDRHSRGLPHDHTKQTDQSWGAPKGDAEWDDEKAGDAIASQEVKAEGFDSTVDAPVDAEGNKPAAETAAAEPEEPEDNSKSYSDYLAEQAEKKLNLGTLNVRKPNEGSKEDKKWATAKKLEDDDEDAYMAGKGEKAKRERERKQKQIVDIDMSFKESSSSRGSERGGRGRGRGDGGFRGDRGGRGEFRGRGDGFRGGRGRGDGSFRGRGEGGFRGGRGGAQAGGRDNVNIADESAFPSLGGS